MSKTAMINARIEPKLKNEVESVLHRLGLNTAQAITLFFRYVRNYGGLPFDVRLPNAATRRAIEDARKGNVKKFSSFKDLAEEMDD